MPSRVSNCKSWPKIYQRLLKNSNKFYKAIKLLALK